MLPSGNALFVFEAAARSGSFTAAAAELNVTQPAVSRMLARFEQYLGVRLFDRTATGAVLTVPCDPRARHGYWLEANVGRAVKKGDWQLSYSRIVIQREAVVGTFNYSEIFPSSDVEIHRPEVMYQLFDNVTLQLNGLFGRPLADAGTKGAVQPLWERLQFDMTYKF